MLYCKDIINHKIGDHTPFEKVAKSLGWTIIIDESATEKAYDGSLWEKGYAPEKPESIKLKERAEELHKLLDEADYWTSKRADGEYTEEEWAEKVAIRKAWREELRGIENAVKEGEVPESDITEHQGAEESREASEAGSSDSSEQSKEEEINNG